jgi:hypothetical protein
MWEDPIVAEVHRIRRELAARFNFDVAAILADMRERQRALGPRLVSLVQSAEVEAESDRAGTDAFLAARPPEQAS